MTFSDQPNAQRPLTAEEQRELFALLLAEEGFTAAAEPSIAAVTHDEPLRLSFAQQRIWFLDLLDPGNPAYNLLAVIEAQGPLDLAVLQRSLQTIVARHAALRTTFTLHNGQPMQVVAPALELPLELIDLAALPVAEQISTTEQQIQAAGQQRFDLTTGPLLRLTAVRHSATRHVLLLTIHHIVSDGWSLGVLIRELAELYAAPDGQRLPDLSVQYPDFAVWQRQQYDSGALNTQRQYWLTQLRDYPPALSLPYDRPRPARTRYHGGRVPLRLSAELSAALRSLSEREGGTLFMTLLSGFGMLLTRYTEQQDILIGTGIANRTRVELEPLIGFFVNTLALRLDLHGDPSLRVLFPRVRETVLQAYAHQDLPFEKLVEELQPERMIHQNPLFNVFFILQNAPLPPLQLPDLTLTVSTPHNETAKFDLYVELFDHSDGISGGFEFDSDLFDSATIERMTAHFEMLLTSLAATPELPLSRLPLVSATERHMLAGWSGAPLPAAPATTVHEMVTAQVARTPDALAVIMGPQRLTFRELDLRAEQLAAYLRRLGAGPDQPVGICMERSPDLLVALLGVLKSGAAYVPLDPSYPVARLRLMLSDVGVSILLTQQALAAQVSADVAHVICLDADWSAIAQTPAAGAVPQTDPAQLAYIIYTSGSTGQPKGVAVTHASIVALLSWAREHFSPADCAAVLASTSICFDISVFELFMPLCWGGCVVLVENALHLSSVPADVAVTLINTVPSAMAELVRGGRIPATVRTVNLAGEPLPGALAEQIYATTAVEHVFNLYGPSEDTVYSTFALVPRGAERPLIGRPVGGSQAHVLDMQMQPVPVGMPGELYLGGAGLARGYFNQSALTAARFVPDPFAQTAPDKPGGRLYKTGDLVRWRPDGQLDYLGRVDQQIKLRGYRIELGEIEAALREHPLVDDVVVLARAEEPARGAAEQRLVAYVVPRDQSSLPASVAEEHIASWQALYDATYSSAASADDAMLNTTVWQSSYTRTPLPAAELEQQIAQTVARTLALKPRRVLELGCGAGQLLQWIAPEVERYLATDMSPVALEQLATQVAARGWSHVRLAQQRADDLHGLDESVDLVLINSVAQYFPDAAYLERTVRSAIEHVVAGGCVLLGDLRALPLLTAYHTSIQLFQAADSLSIGELRVQIAALDAAEEELLVDPSFFAALAAVEPRITQVEIQLRRGAAVNELTRFRYDVLLHIDRPTELVPGVTYDWQRDGLSLAVLEQVLATRSADVLTITGVPNARLREEAAAQTWLATAPDHAIVGELRGILQPTLGIDPEALWSLAERLGYYAELRYGATIDTLTAIFRSTPQQVTPAEQGAQPPSSAGLTNTPTRARLRRMLGGELRRALEQRLPRYMVPSAFVVMDALPLTPNGKLDRRALPKAERSRDSARALYQPPRSELERQLAAIWQQVLQVERVGMDDNFFDLGGHSLLLAQVHGEIQTLLGRDLPIIDLFRYPTISGLARALSHEQPDQQPTNMPQQVARRQEQQRQQRNARRTLYQSGRGNQDE